jgi:AraC family transcriptional regulator
MSVDREFLLQLNDITRRLERDVSLASVAQRAGKSRFQFHRTFYRTAGETLKQFTLRLQLERAAARLVAGDQPILAVALASGFASHEVFARAFRRHFGVSPTEYRSSALTRASQAERQRHLALSRVIGPCIRFFHSPVYKNHRRQKRTTMTTLSITRKEVQPQHILFIRRRIAPNELQKTLGECFGKLFMYGTKAGLPIAGFPLCRYINTGMGLWTIEPAIPMATAVTGEGEMQSGVLPGGPVALGIHGGEYEDLPDTNAAIERWIETNGFKVDGAPWEHYVTDPTQHPNPADWRTEVYWPLVK